MLWCYRGYPAKIYFFEVTTGTREKSVKYDQN